MPPPLQTEEALSQNFDIDMTTIHLTGQRSGATIDDKPMDPPLPTGGGRVIVWIGKRPAVVVRHDQRGTALYNVHDPEGCRIYTRARIRRWWPAAQAFDAPDSVGEMVARAVDGAYDEEASAAGYDSPLSYVMGLVAAIGTASFEELDAARKTSLEKTSLEKTSLEKASRQPPEEVMSR
jgi:hypothetical protein